MALAFMGPLLYIFELDFTTHGPSFKSPDPLGSLNYQCDLVAHSSPTMDPFAHGYTITLIFYIVYEIYSDISENSWRFFIEL